MPTTPPSAKHAAWLVAEVFLHTHVPEWTAVLGWSLLLSNLLALPLMNTAGLMLEGAPAKDFVGVLGAVATSFLLCSPTGGVPDQKLTASAPSSWQTCRARQRKSRRRVRPFSFSLTSVG